MVSEINDIKEILDGNFPINIKLIPKYQQTEPSLLVKYKDGTYHKGSSFRRINIYLKFITCEDNIIIPIILQKYVLYWCHTYIFRLVMDRTEAIICQHFYLHGQKCRLEVSNKL